MVTIEAHELDVTYGNYCDQCQAHTAIHVLVAMVNARTLEVLGHATGARCTHCGHTDEWRW